MGLIILLAIALSLDAFSIAISLGIIQINYKKFIIYSILVGFLHFIMPLLGFLTSRLLLSRIIINGNKLLGIILIFLSVQMFLELKNKNDINLTNINLVTLAISVSLDSYFTGIGINIFNSYIFFVFFIFSCFSFTFTLAGYFLGRKTKSISNNIANYIAIIILLLLGVKYIFYN